MSLPSLSDAEGPIGGLTILGAGSDEPRTTEASDSSQEHVSLASLRKEALGEFPRPKIGSKSTRTVGVGDLPPKRQRMSRPDKVFEEAYFRKIEWSRVFVSGPMNALENPHCFYCQICRRNVSIYWKGAAELKRDYASREHFLKNQKWRYTHLSRTYPVNKSVTLFVRDKKGNLMDRFELELELPKFIDEELVELGDKLPFYEDLRLARDNSTSNRSRSYTKL